MKKILQSICFYGFIAMVIMDVFAFWVFEVNPNHAVAQLLFAGCLVLTLIFCIGLLPLAIIKSPSRF